MIFTPPYRSRIMGQLPGHDPIEIVRFARKICYSDIKFWTRDTDPAWEFWTENTMVNSRTITPRARVAQSYRGGRPKDEPDEAELEGAVQLAHAPEEVTP